MALSEKRVNENVKIYAKQLNSKVWRVMMFIEIKIKPCGNGVQCQAFYDSKDNTIVVVKDGLALGYFCLDELKK